MVGTILSIVSGIIIFWSYIPYMRDIFRGRVLVARSSRIMFVLLLAIALVQQWSVGSGWTLAITVGELIGSIILLLVSIKYGVGGLKKLDLWCYLLLALSLGLWFITDNALIALHLTVLADTIAFTPVLVKTWFKPDSETSFFYIVGVVAPILNIIGGGNFSYAVILFPLYLALINAVEVALIQRRSDIIKQ